MSESQERVQLENRDAHNIEQETAQVTDTSILHPSLAKEQLRTIALQRLIEVRGQLTKAQNQLKETIQGRELDKQQNHSIITQLMEQNSIQNMRYEEEITRLRTQISLLGRIDREEELNNNAESHPSQSQTPTEQPPFQPIRSKVPEPDKFSGADRSQNIENFLVAVERFLRLSRVENSDKIDTTAGFFTGVALDWWISIERTEGEKIRNIGWEEFRQMCLKRFLAITTAETAMKKIGKWKQSGTINSYISSFQNLAQQIPANLLPQEARLLYFIDGLAIDLQKHVKSMRPESIEEAINFAQSIGNVGYTQGGMNNNGRNNQSYTHSQRQLQQQSHNHSVGSRNQPIYLENVNTEVSEVDSSVSVSSSSPHEQLLSHTGIDLSFLTAEQKKLFKEGRCFRCKQAGHRRSECKDNQGSFRQQKN